jgi:hypothetical protein
MPPMATCTSTMNTPVNSQARIKRSFVIRPQRYQSTLRGTREKPTKQKGPGQIALRAKRNNQAQKGLPKTEKKRLAYGRGM